VKLGREMTERKTSDKVHRYKTAGYGVCAEVSGCCLHSPEFTFLQIIKGSYCQYGSHFAYIFSRPHKIISMGVKYFGCRLEKVNTSIPFFQKSLTLLNLLAGILQHIYI